MKFLQKSLILSALLIVFININNGYSQSEQEKIDQLISQKRTFNKNNKNSVVFKIQLFNGNETEAYKVKQDFNSDFPDYVAAVVYNSPEWKTQVGKYKTRLEADKVLLIIKEEYSGAIVLEDKI